MIYKLYDWYPLPTTAAKKMAGEVRIQTFVQLINFDGYRQYSVATIFNHQQTKTNPLKKYLQK